MYTPMMNAMAQATSASAAAICPYPIIQPPNGAARSDRAAWINHLSPGGASLGLHILERLGDAGAHRRDNGRPLDLEPRPNLPGLVLGPADEVAILLGQL